MLFSVFASDRRTGSRSFVNEIAEQEVGDIAKKGLPVPGVIAVSSVAPVSAIKARQGASNSGE